MVRAGPRLQLAASMYGQSTCSVARPCFRCVWDKDDERPPMSLCNYGFTADDCHELKLRVNSNSRKRGWKYFQSLMGQDREYAMNQEAIPKDTGEKCNSISKEPLLYVNELDKHHGEPMHVAQGMLTHLNTEIYKKLNVESESIEGDLYYVQAEACQQYIMDALAIEKSVKFKISK
jgi:hypothetical protein